MRLPASAAPPAPAAPADPRSPEQKVWDEAMEQLPPLDSEQTMYDFARGYAEAARARMFLAHCYGAEAARQRGDAQAATAAIDCIKRMFHFDPKRDRAGEEGGHGHDGHGGGRGDGTTARR